MREQIKTSPVSNYVARGEAISSQGGRKSWGKEQHGPAAVPHGESWAGCPQGQGCPCASAMGTVAPAAASPADTHVQLPEERLQLVSVLELWAEFLVQVCIHLLQELLSVLSVLLKLQEGKVFCERGFSLTKTETGSRLSMVFTQPPGATLATWTPRERQGITISLAQDIISEETTTRSSLFYTELLSPTFPCPHSCFTGTASPRCVVPPLPAPGEGRAKPFHTQTIPWGRRFWHIPRKGTAWAGHHS